MKPRRGLKDFRLCERARLQEIADHVAAVRHDGVRVARDDGFHGGPKSCNTLGAGELMATRVKAFAKASLVWESIGGRLCLDYDDLGARGVLSIPVMLIWRGEVSCGIVRLHLFKSPVESWRGRLRLGGAGAGTLAPSLCLGQTVMLRTFSTLRRGFACWRCLSSSASSVCWNSAAPSSD